MTQNFEISMTPIVGLKVLQRKPIRDERGYFERIYCYQELNSLIGDNKILQINHSMTSKKGTVRGIHFQYPPHAETKLVSCFRGKVFDVAVDLRKDSPTFLQSHAEILSNENLKTFLIPEGFAHGYQTLSDDCEMLYFHTANYVKEAEKGFNSTDPLLRIKWPLKISQISSRDKSHPSITSEFQGI